MDINKKIKYYMELKKVSYSELSKLTGISKSSLQRYVTGTTNKIPFEAVYKIEKALSLEKGVLMGWIEEREELKENELLQLYRLLNDSGKEKAQEYITDLSEQEKYTK